MIPFLTTFLAKKGFTDYVIPAVKFLWKHKWKVSTFICIIIIIFLTKCDGKKTTIQPPKVIIKNVKPDIRKTILHPDKVKYIIDSIYNSLKDSVEVVVVYRDRVIKTKEGRDSVITEAVEIERGRCWNEYHKTLEKLLAENYYEDTIYVVDTSGRKRRPKLDTVASITLSEKVSNNEIQSRTMYFQRHYEKSEKQKNLRIYGGVIGGWSPDGYGGGPSVLFGWKRIGIGYSNLTYKRNNSHNIHLLYNFR